ncbi:hypothetical protein AC792_05260 [Arthrobacter sp. RIT-PI-e]|nr:hypothetical protein AC792_05260 [Arthrobacter sp. RIT-PI-e]
MSSTRTGRMRRSALPALIGVLVLGLLGIMAVILGPALLGTLRSEGGALLAGPECTVRTLDGEVGLTRDEAQRATTAVALRARGAEAPDTSDLDDGVLRSLAEGPADDAGPVLSCRGSAATDLPEEDLTETGLIPRADQVRVAMAEVFGDQSLGGFAPGGVGEGHGGDSTHYSGRAIDVFFRPVTEENRRQGWMLAHWLVAHAEDLDIQYVIFDDQFWSSHLARGQWHPYDAPAPANEILRHLDHVHVDVLRGGDG